MQHAGNPYTLEDKARGLSPRTASANKKMSEQPRAISILLQNRTGVTTDILFLNLSDLSDQQALHIKQLNIFYLSMQIYDSIYMSMVGKGISVSV